MPITLKRPPADSVTEFNISLKAPPNTQEILQINAPKRPKPTLQKRVKTSALDLDFTSPTRRTRRVLKEATEKRKRNGNGGRKTLQATLFPSEVNDPPPDGLPTDDWTDNAFDGHDGMPIDTYDENEDKDFWEYAETVLADAVTFNQVCPDLFVVEGWDSRSKAGTVRPFPQ